MQIREEIDYLPSQKETLQHVLYDPSILAILFYGGVRGGKTLTGCKALQYVSQMFPGSRSLAARDTRVNLKSTTLNTFFGVDGKGHRVILPQLFDPRNYNKSEGTLTWNNGSQTSFWGLDDTASIERVKSTEWSFILLEECTGILFKIIMFLLETRLSHPVGPWKMLLTTNTDKGQEEVYDLFFKKHTCDPDKYCKECDGKCRFRRVHAATEDNFGNLPEKYVRNVTLKAKTDPEYAKVFFRGEFKSFSKLVYPEFDERLHVLDFPPDYQWAGAETVYGYDHGYGGAPSCLLEAKCLYDGTIVYWNEYYEKGRSVHEMANDFKGLGINYVHCADPSIRSQNQYRKNASGIQELCSVQDLYQDEGVTMGLANNDLNGGIERVKNLLVRSEGHTNPINGLPNAPHFFIARVGGVVRCPNLMREIQRLRNKEDARGNTNPKKWVPEGDDHAADPARYIVNSRPSPGSFGEQEPEPGTVEYVVRKQIEKEKQKRGGAGGMKPVSSAL